MAGPGRRAFLRAALGGGLFAAGAARAQDPLTAERPASLRALGPGVTAAPYGMPSPYERHVVRRHVPLLNAAEESDVNFTPLHQLDGSITPNGLCFERHHSGVPAIDPAAHRLLIHGLVERPLVLNLADLARFPSVSRILFVECAGNGGMEWRGARMSGVQFTHGMVHCCEWTGVALSALLAETGVRPEARWLLAEGADAALMTRSIPLAKALDDVIVAYSQNGERLRPENGYPLRLIVPGWEGAINVKWLRRLKLGDQPWHHREETARYTDLMPDGTARQFTFVQEANSCITFPSPEVGLADRGPYEIRGLAWSGRGRIARVDVSLDGGANWRPARLQEPVLPMALTRFRLPWRWDGVPALLQARATDEAGYVQPTIAQLRAARGVNSIYHKNAIHTWRVNADGTVDNVQLA
jgi:sulfane dehydrogenase subunit SoxC